MRASSIPESHVNPLPTSILNDATLVLALASNQTNVVILSEAQRAESKDLLLLLYLPLLLPFLLSFPKGICFTHPVKLA